jgi:hypothetical protein
MGRAKMEKHASAVPGANDGLFIGFRFYADLDLHTPLKALKMHGQEIRGRRAPPAEALPCGRWVPIFSAARRPTDLSMSLEWPGMTSDGPLELLVAIREAVEAMAPVEARRERLSLVLAFQQHERQIDRLGGKDAILDRFFPSFLSCAVRARAEPMLRAMGLTTPRAILRMSDDQLARVPTLGLKTVRHLREICRKADDLDSTYVDSGLAALDNLAAH